MLIMMMSSSTIPTVRIGNRPRRQMWSNQHPLRKQKSLTENTTLGLLTRANSNNSIKFGQEKHFGKYQIIRRQSSVDQTYRKIGEKCRSTSIDRNYCKSSDGRNNKNFILAGKNPAGKLWSSEDAGIIESFSKVSINCDIKKVGNNQNGNFDVRKDIKDAANLKNSTKSKNNSGEDRINLKIFLGHEVISHDHDGLSSDLDSGNEISDKELNVSHYKKNSVPKSSVENQTNVTAPTATKRPPSALIRRTQFQTSRHIENGVSIPSQIITTVNASPSLTVEKRPPLIRAMSAPPRTFDENSKSILYANQKKKPARRRRPLIRNATIQPSSTDDGLSVIETVNSGLDNDSANARRIANSKKLLTRGRTTLGVDVVTLVSLLSSEGSDSEKEEPSISSPVEIPILNSLVRRPPLLKKSGKSVSFQESDIPVLGNTTRELPHMLRRGSVAPLAARIRANRPPTAPPGSIFMPALENNDFKMSSSTTLHMKSTSKEDLSNFSSSESPKLDASKENEMPNSKDINETVPEHVHSKKEHECWKLFQKMITKGVIVSYDTVLRGMLTPTEFRQIQKQRDAEEAKKALEAATIETLEKNNSITSKKK